MFVKGMMMEEVMAMIETEGWEVVEREEYEAYDDTMAVSLTVEQGDHYVGVDIFHGQVESLEYIPAWMM